jgi:NitT/TauT family transport system permease protein
MSTVEQRQEAREADTEMIEAAPRTAARMAISQSCARGLIALLVAIGGGLGLHLVAARNEPLQKETWLYTNFLCWSLGLTALGGIVQIFSPAFRRWMRETCPLLAAGFVALAAGEAITTGLRWLPASYFPSPAGILYTLVEDRAELLMNAWHSFALLLKGYALGVIVGVVAGICIGWFGAARYWGMPVLKLIGPIPATAWVPIAMIITSFLGAPSGSAAVSLIALAVWFPVAMLTASGISNVRSSLLDVARTLGAGRAYLIFRVAIPAAMPSIFIGLFMGLSAAFLTLIVAEGVGVKAGLGWYIAWAQGWNEYKKVFAALVIMAAFFSSIMTLLFKLRDRVLVWQKGTIKW